MIGKEINTEKYYFKITCKEEGVRKQYRKRGFDSPDEARKAERAFEAQLINKKTRRYK